VPQRRKDLGDERGPLEATEGADRRLDDLGIASPDRSAQQGEVPRRRRTPLLDLENGEAALGDCGAPDEHREAGR
jgi:hypothetical protein